jgi:copper(I)-binding protein
VIRSSTATARPCRLLVLAIAALMLTACEAGNNAPTTQWHPPTAGTDKMVGDVSITNAFVLGAPIGRTVPAGGSASVFLALSNTGSPDKLLSISAPGTARSVTLPGGSVSIASQKVVLLTGPGPEVILNDLSRPLAGGSTVRLVLNFENAGTNVSLTVPVMPRASFYSTLLPPKPSPSAAATRAAASPSATPTPTRTATPSPSASP